MLRSKHILLIILFFVGVHVVSQTDTISVETQYVASQSVCDTSKIDTIKLADAEFEAWLDKYAVVVEDTSLVGDTTIVNVTSDFSSLVDQGEAAREREKNELIMKVMTSMKEKSTDDRVQITDNREQVVDSGRQSYSPPRSSIISPNLGGELDNQLLALRSQLLSTDSLLSEVNVVLSGQNFQEVVNPIFLDWVLGVLPAVSQSFDDEDSVVISVRAQAKNYVKANAPELYAYHRDELPSMSELEINQMHQARMEKLLLNLDTLNKSKTSQLNVDLPEMSKWSKGAKFQVHVSQNYITANWYKGGESNLASTFYALGYFNYNNRKGLQWDNKVEWKLGLYGMASDSLRWLRVNEDLLRFNSKLGYKAFKNFYYTAEWDFQTSLFNTYKSNTYIRTSGPFSPIRMNLSLGMDYKYKKIVSVFISPLSYKLVYVADMRTKNGVLETENIACQVGITDGTPQSNQLGALVRTDFDYDFNESIGMEVHFSFFGNYVGKIKGVEVGCELIGNFKINRFLSAKVSLYPRYDSTTKPADGGKPKLQFYELISLGFNYKL